MSSCSSRLPPKRLLVFPAASALLALLIIMTSHGSRAAAAGGDRTDEVVIPVTTPQGVTILAELADTTAKRARGLMFRESLAKDRGMLFTFAEPGYWTFWMKNTRIALDIIWMDRNTRIVYLEENVPGCSRTDDGCPQYQPNVEAMFVLELAAGMVETLKLKKGMALNFKIPPGHP